MSHQALNNVIHKDIKIITERHANYGDNQSLAHVFPIEFAQLQNDFPILLKRNNQGDAYEFVVLMGFEKDQNLFLSNNQWLADSVPLTLEKGPFLIGFEMQMEQGVPVETPVLHIDVGHPRVNHSEGEALFLPHGGNTEYLERINSILMAIYQGHQQSQQFISLLEKHQLIEPLSLNITFKNGDKKNLTGLFTINEERLPALSGSDLSEFHQHGFLSSIYMMLASLPNIKKLVTLKNQQD